MSNIAYTIGRTTAYEKAINEPGGTKKLGRREVNPLDPNEPSYEGGWVWRTWKGAEDFRANLMSIEIPAWAAMDFSVYELELPTSWEEDVCHDPIVKSKTAGGAHYLLHDSKVVRAVYTDPEIPAEGLLISADALVDIAQQIVIALQNQGYRLTIKQASHLKHAVLNYQAIRNK